jgi:hypothetical protein
MQVANYSGRRAYPRIDERGTWSAERIMAGSTAAQLPTAPSAAASADRE